MKPTAKAGLIGAVITLMLGLLAVASPAAPAAAEQTDSGQGEQCFAQVDEFIFERTNQSFDWERHVPIFETENRYEKEVRIKGSDPEIWTDWPGAGPRAWGWDGRKEGPHSSSFTYEGQRVRSDRYRYVVVDTREVQVGTTTETATTTENVPPAGDGWELVGAASSMETTDWVTEAPAGDGWVQVDQRTVDGERIPCPVEKLRLTFMQECGVWNGSGWDAPETVEFRLRNSNDGPVDYVLKQAGVGVIESGTLPVGDTFIEFPFGPRTLILETINDLGGVAHRDTKAGGDTFLTTDDDDQKCRPDTPDPLVETSEWVDGDFECDDTTVVQTRTVTTTPYIWDGSGFVLDTENAKVETETQVRDLTADEIVPCPTEPPTTEPPTTEPPVTEPPAPTAPPAPPITELPATGGNGPETGLLIGFILTALGGAALLTARRRSTVS